MFSSDEEIRAELLRLQKEDPSAIEKLEQQLDEYRVALSRQDPNYFVQYVLRDEETQEPIRQAPYHEKLQEACTASKAASILGHTELGKCVTSQTIFIRRDGLPVTLLELKADLDAGKKVEVLSLNQKTRSHEWVEVESIEYDGHVPCTMITSECGAIGVYSNNHPVYVGVNMTRGAPPSREGWSMASNVLKRHHRIATLGQYPKLDKYSDMSSEDAFALGVILNGMAKRIIVPKAYLGAELVLSWTIKPKLVSNEYDVVRLIKRFCDKMGFRFLYFPSKENEFTLTRKQYLVIEGITSWLNERGYYVNLSSYTVPNVKNIQTLTSQNSAFFHPELFQLTPEAAKAFVAGFLLMQITDQKNSGYTVLPKFNRSTYLGMYWMLKVAGINADLFLIKKSLKYFVKIKIITVLDILSVLDKHTLENPVVKALSNNYKWTLGLIGGKAVGLDEDTLLPQSDYLAQQIARAREGVPTWRWIRTATVISAGVEATYAVTIKSEEHTHLTDGMLTHNTQQISIGRSLWEIGRNPNIRICIIQATEGLAEDIVSTIKRYIEHSPEYKRIFPHVRRGVEWTTTSLSVERSPTIKDPTVLAAGVHGNILGRRFDLVIGDDFLTAENTATEYMRDDVFNWMLTTPMSRITRNGRIWLIGNAWSREDALHRFARMAGWNHYVFPVRDPVTKKSYWPERWPQDRIEDFEMRRTPWEVARALDCKARSDEAGRFRESWFTAALERGHGMFGDDTMCWALAQMPPGCQTFTGVDLGISESAGADVTAISTLMIKPDGRISLINIEAGNWDANEIIDRIVRAHMRFKSLVFVESLFAQRWILQLIRKKAPFVPVFPFQTRGTGTVRNKRHTFYGVESLAAELAQGLWDIPRAKTGQVDPEIQSFIQGCLVYAPDEHTDDRVMSVWIALQGARKQTGIIGTGLTAESGMEIMLDTQPLSYEERMEHARNERALDKEKSAASWWEDVRNELDLPDFDKGE